MLQPEQIYIIPLAMIELFQEFEEKLLADISKRIAKAGAVTETALIKSQAYAELLGAQETVLSAIENINADALEELLKTLSTTVEWAEQNDAITLGYVGLKPPTLENSPYLKQLLDAAMMQTSGTLLNITQSMGFKFAGTPFAGIMQTYQKVMDTAVLDIVSGAYDYNTAIRNAVKSLADSGIRTIDYESGYSYSLEVATRRSVMTGVSQLSGNISEMNAALIGTDYYEISAHTGARPDHAKWQGGQYKMYGSSPGYPNLVEVTGYGTGEGLKGWNCRHDMFPIIPGISKPTYTKRQLKDIDGKPFYYEGVKYTAYEATQQQRKLEYAIRKAKRRVVVYNAAGLEEEKRIINTRLRLLRQKYKDFSGAAGLYTQYNRTFVA